MAPKIIFVDDMAKGSNDGTSWANAYWYLQDAINEPVLHGDSVTIKVAQGLYTPDRSAANPQGTGDRSAAFRLVDNVVMEGGYAGIEGGDPNERVVSRYRTILSGDLRANDVIAPDPTQLITHPSRAENTYHVIIAAHVNANTVLDGFSVESAPL